MKKYLFIIFIILYFLFSIDSSGQNNTEDKKRQETMILANSKLMHNIVVVTDRNGNVNRGFFIGLKADTIIFSRQNEQFKYSLKDLINVTIDVEPSNTKGLLIGGVLGMYIANISILRAENQPFAYMNDDGLWRSVIFSLVFGSAGGGIGYLIEANSAKEQIDFIFSDDPLIWKKEFERFKQFIIGEEQEKSLHISIQLYQVSTRLSNSNDPKQYYYEAKNFNLMRKLDVTYSFFNKINLGMAICWFSEPSFHDWVYEELNYTSIFVKQKYDGIGYYAVGTYEPFKKVIYQTVSWKVGMGIGIGDIDYRENRLKENYVEGENSSETFETAINKSLFSGIIFTNLDFYLNNSLSLGFSADYVYLAETMPTIPELNIGKSNFGNYSLGLNFSLHF